MNDLVIDDDYLSQTAADLEGLSTELESLCSGLRGVEALVVGAQPLFDKLSSFAEAWSRCSEDLSEYAEKGALNVRTILEAFDEVDAGLADGMNADRADVPGGTS